MYEDIYDQPMQAGNLPSMEKLVEWDNEADLSADTLYLEGRSIGEVERCGEL